MKLLAFCTGLACILLNTTNGCRDSGIVTSSPSHPTPVAKENHTISRASDQFGFHLFAAVDRAEGKKNLFISPLSVSMALGVLLNGAHGATYDSIVQTLALGGLNQSDINGSYENLMASLTTRDPSVTFQIANSIWYRNTFAVESLFVNLSKQYFHALVQPLDFTDPQAASVINSWVEQSTNGKITGIVNPPIPRDIVMYLIDAIYFKGAWTYIFDSMKTVDDSFTVVNGSRKPVRMMNQTNKYLYYQNNNIQMVDLPYGAGDFRMTVVLPSPGTDIDQMILSTDQQVWNVWIAALDSMNGHLALPKFSLQYDLTMNDVLKSLGMSIAFDTRHADFAYINPVVQLYVSSVKHKSYVEVNEEGTEAAAVTSVEIGITAVRRGEGKTFNMVVNRPFVFLIRDVSSGTILFIGKIVDPTG